MSKHYLELINFSKVHHSWRDCLIRGLEKLPPEYCEKLFLSSHWLPGPNYIFNAFSLPISHIHYILFGESPYPRKKSANGFAFWDDAVTDLWSETGLSKSVNRATSLRNIIKMLLVASGRLNPNHTSQSDIVKIDKSKLVQTNAELFQNLIAHGFLLLNATPVLQPRHLSTPQKDAKVWRPFIKELLTCLLEKRPDVTFLLFGQIAHKIEVFLPAEKINKLIAEHPYNVSFITNQNILDFFRPLHLLKKKQKIF